MNRFFIYRQLLFTVLCRNGFCSAYHSVALSNIPLPSRQLIHDVQVKGYHKVLIKTRLDFYLNQTCLKVLFTFIVSHQNVHLGGLTNRFRTFLSQIIHVYYLAVFFHLAQAAPSGVNNEASMEMPKTAVPVVHLRLTPKLTQSSSIPTLKCTVLQQK